MRSRILIPTLVLLLGVVPRCVQADATQDETIAKRIARDLQRSGRLQGYKIGVKVRDGKAWLLGEVANAEQSRAATKIARQRGAIRDVVNKLTIGDRRREGVSKTSASSQPLAASDLAPAMQDRLASTRQANAHARQNHAGVPGGYVGGGSAPMGRPIPAYVPAGTGAARARFDEPYMPGYAWPSYASYPNYAALTYPRQYSPTAWPYIGPFYPYPQVPLGWRKVELEWDDGWWFLDFKE